MCCNDSYYVVYYDESVLRFGRGTGASRKKADPDFQSAKLVLLDGGWVREGMDGYSRGVPQQQDSAVANR